MVFLIDRRVGPDLRVSREESSWDEGAMRGELALDERTSGDEE